MVLCKGIYYQVMTNNDIETNDQKKDKWICKFCHRPNSERINIILYKLLKRSRKGPTKILGPKWTPLMKNIFRPYFLSSPRNMAYIINIKIQKKLPTNNKKEYKVSGRPHEGLRTIVQSFTEKYFSANLSFSREIFFIISILLRSFSTLWLPQGLVF